MNETLKAAGHIGAELGAAIAEVQRLRGLLREAEPYVTARAVGPMETSYLLQRVRAALSKQAEPKCDNCEGYGSRLATNFDGLPVIEPCPCREKQAEPAPAQDEREAFETWFLSKWPTNQLYRRDALPASDPHYDEYCNPHVHHAHEGWQARATRPAQTEQQATVKDCLTVQPMAYAVFAANGNAVCFSTRRDHPSLVELEKEGQSVVPLAPIAQTEQQPDGEAVEIVASAIDGPCREVESIDDMAQIICGQLAEAGFLRVRKSEAANFAAPIADVLCRFGLSRDDAEALGAELAIALIQHLAQWDEDHHAAPIAQTAPQPEQSADYHFRSGALEFAGYLLDNCEGATVAEESLKLWLSEALRKKSPAPSATPSPAKRGDA